MDSLKQHIAKYEAEKAKLAKLPPHKHIEKIEKTSKSIAAHARRPGTKYDSPRTQELISRYNKHADAMKEHHPKEWKEYCAKNKLDPHHHGGDVWA